MTLVFEDVLPFLLHHLVFCSLLNFQFTSYILQFHNFWSVSFNIFYLFFKTLFCSHILFISSVRIFILLLRTFYQENHLSPFTKVCSWGFIFFFNLGFSSVQFSPSVVSNFLWPHELQHTRPPCLSPAPGVYSNSCTLSWWCPLAISSSVVPFSSCPQFLPASGSFPMRQLFTWGGQSIGVSASALG